MKKVLILIACIAAMTTGVKAQILKPVKWQISSEKVSEGIYDIICKATIDENWHLYDTDLPSGGPLSTSFNMDEDESSDIELVNKFKAKSQPETEHSDAFGMDLKYFKNSVTFVQRVKVTQSTGKLVGYIEFMACTGGTCIPPAEAEFDLTLKK